MTNDNKLLIILGAGESGVGAALLGQQQGWRVFVSDGGKIKEQYKAELNEAGIQWEEGGHSMEFILTADCIVKSPGIPEKTAVMQSIREGSMEVCSEIEFGYRYKGEGKIIAITGSNGKSTTTKLTHHMLTHAGLDAAMVGNIGYSFARQVYQQPHDWYVIEVSSFQLDDIRLFRPDVAVLLNITPDHLDRYQYRMDKYVHSKFRITENQMAADKFIVNQDDPIIKNYLDQHEVQANKLFFTMNEKQAPEEGAFIQHQTLHLRYDGEEETISVKDLTIRGRHNQYNSMAAGISAASAGIRKSSIRESLYTFKGLEHRLEKVGEVDGVTFINDSKATNMNSVWYALEDMKQPTILILGGQDKGNDYTEILELVREKVKAIVCLGADNSPIHAFFKEEHLSIEDTDNALDAVHAAFNLAEPGDAVLLSPGCASFDLFKNYEDRGTQFKDAVKNL